RVPLTGDLTEQREGNNALPGPWGSRDDDHGLAVTAAGFLDLVEHELVRHPLLVEEDELLTIADLGSGQVKELLGRLNARTEEVVRNVDAGLPRQVGPQESLEVGPTLTGEDRDLGGC